MLCNICVVQSIIRSGIVLKIANFNISGGFYIGNEKQDINVIKKELFPNPRLSKTTSLGNTYYTYDKGYMICEIVKNNKPVKILTHHGFPYRRFNSTPEENLKVFEFFDKAIITNNIDIVTGDFNAENFMILMPKTMQEYKRTINEITTVDNKKFDDILLKKNVNYTKK